MPQFLNGNYIDLVILLILVFYISEAFRHGFWIILADFTSFFGSLILSLRFYKYVALFLKANFSLNLSVANAIDYLFAAIIFESILAFVTAYLIHKLPDKIRKHRLNKWFGVIPAMGEGLIIIAFILTLMMALPIKPQVKTDISESKIGGVILDRATAVEKSLNEVFGGVINDSLTYFTVNPNSKDTINLDVGTLDLKVDEKSEKELFVLVNNERKKIAIRELTWDPKIVLLSREYATDLWTRHYFSHYSPEGKNVGDRLNLTKINYSYAGENLALAPTIKTAHSGLMASKGHRENILNPRFSKMGIGVIDNVFYGKIFVQVFTD